MYFKLLSFIFLAFIITGCSNKQTSYTNTYSELNNLPFPSASLENTLSSVDYKLQSFYNEWRGVKYKWGGNSKRGIDCSAFIQQAYKKSFNIKIPRTTKTQVKVGKTIKRSQLKLGDLVFFKTGYDQRHVGIYLDNGKFMHASTKRGVIISKLNNSYYNRHYWTAKRIIF